jgi:hypothetical protein
MKALKLTEFWVTIATDCQALTACMNVNYALSYEQASSFCFNASSMFCEEWMYRSMFS